MSCFLCFSHRYCHSSSRFVSPFRFSHCFSLFLFFILWLFVVDCLLPLPFVNSLIILSLSLRLSPFLRALSSSSLSSSPLFHPFIPPFNLPFQIPPEFQNAFRYTQHSAFQRLFVPSLVCLCDDCSTPSLLLHPFDSLTKPARSGCDLLQGKLSQSSGRSWLLIMKIFGTMKVDPECQDILHFLIFYILGQSVS